MYYSSRLTIDMHQEEHAYIKIVSAQLGIPMREFVLMATFEKIKEVEDEWLSGRAEEILQRLKTEKQKVS